MINTTKVTPFGKGPTMLNNSNDDVESDLNYLSNVGHDQLRNQRLGLMQSGYQPHRNVSRNGRYKDTLLNRLSIKSENNISSLQPVLRKQSVAQSYDGTPQFIQEEEFSQTNPINLQSYIPTMPYSGS